jgi:hypothetical protein
MNMCFSASISFFAAGLLVCVAIAAYKKIKECNEIPLASIPLIFALQQAAEGCLWLLLPTHSYPDLIVFCMYVFLGSAFVVWPIFIPCALILLESHPLRRALMGFSLLLGSAWSVASLWHLVEGEAQVSIQSCHILYQLPGLEVLQGLHLILLYCCATLIPFLVASSFLLRLTGAIIGLSCVLSYFIWYFYFISTWCFFAALISLSIYAVLIERHRGSTPKQSFF